MKRPRESQQNPQMDLISQLGLFQDPMQQLGGLVNLVNSLGEEDRYNREMLMKQQAQEQEASQFMASQDLAYEQLDAREESEDEEGERWKQEFGLKKFLADEERRLQMTELTQRRDAQNRGLAAELLGLPARYQQSDGSMPVNPAALTGLLPPGMEGLASFFQSAPAQSTETLTPQNKDQELLLKTRRSMGL